MMNSKVDSRPTLNENKTHEIYDTPQFDDKNDYAGLETSQRPQDNYDTLGTNFNAKKENKIKKFLNSILNNRRKFILFLSLITGFTVLIIAGIILAALALTGILAPNEPNEPNLTQPAKPSFNESSSLIRTIAGHSNFVWALAVLQNGYLVSGSRDETIKIWNVNDDGSLIRTILTNYTSLLSPFGYLNGYLASASHSEKTIKIWNTNDGTLIANLIGHSAEISSLAEINRTLASSSYDGEIKIWNVTTASLIRTITAQVSVNSLAVSYLFNQFWYLILVSGTFKEIKFWDTNTGTLIYTIAHNSPLDLLVALRNGNLASCFLSNTAINIWNTTEGSLEKTLIGHTNGVSSLAVLASGFLASGSFDSSIKIWNVNDGRLMQTLTLTDYGLNSAVVSLVVLENGYLASGYANI
jgi:WD40 repeat protein